ncbi:hypothetical protein ES703_66561 [subsurface metagenome]
MYHSLKITKLKLFKLEDIILFLRNLYFSRGILKKKEGYGNG